MEKKNRKFKLSIAQKIVLSFIGVIFIGSLLLNLDIAQVPGSQATYFDHLFSAVSMVSVTGLFTEPVVSTYNTFGQVINMVLIQIGGLGLMTIIALIFFSVGKRVSYTDKMTLSEMMNKEGLQGLGSYILRLVKTTFIVELIGAFLLMIRFIPQFGFGQGIFNSFYIAISGFNNAGFDNFSTYSLLDYVHDPLVSIVVSSLVIFGGLGFAVWFDFFDGIYETVKNKRSLKTFFKNLRIHSKIVINMTLIVLTFGTVIIMAIEYNNPATLGHFTFGQKLLASYFQSVTMHTAGFATLNYSLFYGSSLLIYVALMFIGGSPGGTAGGVKTTTFALVVLYFKSQITKRKHTNIYNRTIHPELISKALTIFIAYMLVLFIGTFAMISIHPEINPIFLLFEAISGLATVGVTANVTPLLSMAAQGVLMLLMFGGRIGPLTLFLSLNRPHKLKDDHEHPSANILIG